MLETIKLKLKKWVNGDNLETYHQALNDNFDILDNEIGQIKENTSLLGKILCFTTSVTRPALTFSSSTNFYFCTLSIPLPAGYTAVKGAYNKGDFLIQPIDSGLWLCHPVAVSSDGKTLIANLGTGANLSAAGTIVVRVHVRVH